MATPAQRKATRRRLQVAQRKNYIKEQHMDAEKSVEPEMIEVLSEEEDKERFRDEWPLYVETEPPPKKKGKKKKGKKKKGKKKKGKKKKRKITYEYYVDDDSCFDKAMYCLYDGLVGWWRD